MLHGVAVGRRFAGCMVFVKSKEPALMKIKGRPTVRICTRRKHGYLPAVTARSSIPIHEFSLHMDLRSLASPGPLGSLGLQLRDGLLQPFRHGRRHLFARSRAIQRIQSLPALVHRYVPAELFFALQVFRYELSKHAIAARP